MKRAWLPLILALIGTAVSAQADQPADKGQQPVDAARRYVDAFVAGDMQTLLDHASPPLKQLVKDAATLGVLRNQSVGDGSQTAGEEVSITCTRLVKSASGQKIVITAQVTPDGELVLFSVKPADANPPGGGGGAANAQSPSSKSVHEKSPFAAVRWKESKPEVKVDEKWFTLVSLDGIATAEIVTFSKRAYEDKWRMRFEEDLVELLTRMGHKPKETVRLVVRPIGSTKTQTLPDVAMTRANRDSIREASGR